MKIVVIGGSGLIGTKVVDHLRARGHDTLAASPSSGVNAVTGEGLSAALAGAQVVVDVANSPSFEDKAVLEFFEASGRHLFAAEKTADVAHHVALSVVGTNRLAESGYFRAKIAQERLIRESGVPYTIVQSTQFFEFVSAIAQSATESERASLPPADIQPISSDDIALAVAECAQGAPLNGVIEVAGPERMRLADLIQRYFAASHDPRKAVEDPRARYFGAKLAVDTLVPGANARLGRMTFEEWFRRAQAAAAQ